MDSDEFKLASFLYRVNLVYSGADLLQPPFFFLHSAGRTVVWCCYSNRVSDATFYPQHPRHFFTTFRILIDRAKKQKRVIKMLITV